MLGALPYRTFPEIHLGPLTLHTFGLFVGLGVLVGVYLLALHMERTTGLDRDTTYKMAFWTVVIGFVGARLTFVATNWSDIHSPLDVVAVWKGGLQFAGGFIGGSIYATLWLRRHPAVDTWRMLDGVGLALVSGVAIGRIGCYSVGEHLGGKTSFFLGVKYLGGATRENCPLNGGPCFQVNDVIHNTSLYEFIHLALLFALLLYLRKAKVRSGTLFVIFLAWYGVARFLTDFLRAYDRTKLGLTGAQWMSLGMLVAAVVLARRRFLGAPQEEPDQEEPVSEAKPEADPAEPSDIEPEDQVPVPREAVLGAGFEDEDDSP